MRPTYHRKTTGKVAAVLFTVCSGYNHFMVGRNRRGVKIFSCECESWLVAKN